MNTSSDTHGSPLASQDPVLVTGGSGWLATFCIAALLERGATVRTTVRDLAASGSVSEAVERLTPVQGRLDVQADLLHDDGWRAAAEGCATVLHTASPFPSERPKNADELICPARDGALRVLRAARDAGSTRLVMTSSVAAVSYGHGSRTRPFTERDWSDVSNSRDISPYEQSKTLAERAAWDFVAEQPGAPELVTICPGGILGPVAGPGRSSSMQIVSTLIDGSVPGLARFGWPIVDVRDVAELHLLALESPAAAGQRFIAGGPFLQMADVAATLRRGAPELAQKVPTRTLPDGLVRLSGLFNASLRGRLYELGKQRPVSSQKAEVELGWAHRPAEETILDTAHSLVAAS